MTDTISYLIRDEELKKKIILAVDKPHELAGRRTPLTNGGAKLVYITESKGSTFVIYHLNNSTVCIAYDGQGNQELNNQKYVEITLFGEENARKAASSALESITGVSLD